MKENNGTFYETPCVKNT